MVTKQNIYAALDLGTNNCRLSVAIKDVNFLHKYKIIERYATQVRLGEGLDESGYLSEEAINRAIAALLICKEYLEKYNIYKERYIATEACRVAKNNTYFIEQVYFRTGIELNIINKEEEAKLAVLACSDIIKNFFQPVLLFDIGGGSSQLAFINEPNQHYGNVIDHIIGLDLGVVNMRERFKAVLNNKDYFNIIKKYAKDAIKDIIVKQNLSHLLNTNYQIIGTSGTATTLAAIYLNLASYDRKKTDGLWILQNDLKMIINKIIESDDKDIANIPCIGEERADLVIAGCAIFSAILELWSSQKLKVADRGLRDGILLQLIKSN